MPAAGKAAMQRAVGEHDREQQRLRTRIAELEATIEKLGGPSAEPAIKAAPKPKSAPATDTFAAYLTRIAANDPDPAKRASAAELLDQMK